MNATGIAALVLAVIVFFVFWNHKNRATVQPMYFDSSTQKRR